MYTKKLDKAPQYIVNLFTVASNHVYQNSKQFLENTISNACKMAENHIAHQAMQGNMIANTLEQKIIPGATIIVLELSKTITEATTNIESKVDIINDWIEVEATGKMIEMTSFNN
jgi:hypothetical protein